MEGWHNSWVPVQIGGITLGNFFKIDIHFGQGWQVSANGGLNRSLIRFKPSWQKQVSASVSARVLDNNAKMKEFIITMCN